MNPHSKEKSHRSNLLYGVHAVSAALLNPERQCHKLLTTKAGLESLASVWRQVMKNGLKRPEPKLVDKSELDKLLPGAVHQGVVLEVSPLPEMSLEEFSRDLKEGEGAILVILDQVTDPHNIGAILRSASAFGAKGVVVTDRHAPEATGTLAKSASGAMEHVPLIRVTNLSQAMSQLQKGGFWCVGLAESGQRNLAELDLSGRIALVLGAEGAGLRRLTMENCDEVVRLPTQGPVGSLNVSNAAAVSLYEVANHQISKS